MSGRLKELRDARRISQGVLGREIGTSQQNLSRYEVDVNKIPADMLIRLANYYNVTTDYILGRTDVKRSAEGQARVNKIIEEHYDFLEIYRGLSEESREVVWHLTEDLRKLEKKRAKKR